MERDRTHNNPAKRNITTNHTMKEPRRYRPDNIKDIPGRAPGESHKDMILRHSEERANRRARHAERRSVRSAPPSCLV